MNLTSNSRILLLAMTIIVAAFSNAIYADAPKEGILPGNLILDFRLNDLDGNEVGPRDYQGKVVFIFFWGNNCSWCQKELPFVEDIHRRFSDEVAVLTINVDGSPANARKFAAKYGYTIPILIDNGITLLRFGQRGVPHNVIVNPEGIISSARPGYIEWQELHRLLIDAGARLEKD